MTGSAPGSEPAVTSYSALFNTDTAVCRNESCGGEIFWHPTARRWLHKDTRITVCDAFSADIQTASPKEIQQ